MQAWQQAEMVKAGATTEPHATIPSIGVEMRLAAILGRRKEHALGLKEYWPPAYASPRCTRYRMACEVRVEALGVCNTCLASA